MRSFSITFPLSGLFMFICVLTSHPLTGQLVIREPYPLYRFGFGAGLTVSGFTSDSVGFNGTVMPYGALILEADLSRRISLNGELNYLVYGINRESPYQRYRYTYVHAAFSAGYNFMGFLRLGAGYRYGFAQNARMALLDGNSASGVTKVDITSFGNYGQPFALADIQIDELSTIIFRYGIPTASVPLKHIQIGIRINIDGYSKSERVKASEKKQQTARIQAEMLRNGVLLVRLRSMRSSIEAMESHGMMQDAAALRETTHRENLQLIQAFGKYSFSKVYFFYDYHSDLVRAGKLDSILLDNHLQPVTPDTVIQHLFIAAVGNYASPDRSYHAMHDPQYLKENKIAHDSSAAYIQYSHQASRIGGIVIMDHTFEPLPEPFPVFTPMLNPSLFRAEVRLERAVVNLNEGLFKLLFSK